MSVTYTYGHCGKEWVDAVDDYWMQPCPSCGERVEPCRVDGIPYLAPRFVPRYDTTFGQQVNSRREEKILRAEFGVEPMGRTEFKRTIEEPVLHECWKKDNGLPAFEDDSIKGPSKQEVHDGLERVRYRLANDDEYRRQHDPKHPGFASHPDNQG